VDEDVLLGVVTVDEAVAALHVEPFDGASDFCSDDFFRFFFFQLFVVTAALAAGFVAVGIDDLSLGYRSGGWAVVSGH